MRDVTILNGIRNSKMYTMFYVQIKLRQINLCRNIGKFALLIGRLSYIGCWIFHPSNHKYKKASNTLIISLSSLHVNIMNKNETVILTNVVLVSFLSQVMFD